MAGGEQRRFTARDNFDDVLFALSVALACRRPGRLARAVDAVLFLRDCQTTDDLPITAKELVSSIRVHAVVPCPTLLKYHNIFVY